MGFHVCQQCLRHASSSELGHGGEVVDINQRLACKCTESDNAIGQTCWLPIYPSNEREVIERIEIIKITPQVYVGEAVSPLIQDPWKSIPCQGIGECIVEFEDQNFSRDSVYYVRAIQHRTPAINGSPLSQRDNFKLCKGSFRTDLADDCLSMTNERAWSSPIYVDKP